MASHDATAAITELVDRETRAWDTQDVELLLSIFHPDMVWPWPPTPADHDPIGWEMVLGRFDRERWRLVYQALFARFALVHNHRGLRRVILSTEGDGGMAVVDIDTLWRSGTGEVMHWVGRTGKVYTRTADGWKLIMHTGVLDYGEDDGPGGAP